MLFRTLFITKRGTALSEHHYMKRTILSTLILAITLMFTACQKSNVTPANIHTNQRSIYVTKASNLDITLVDAHDTTEVVPGSNVLVTVDGDFTIQYESTLVNTEVVEVVAAGKVIVLEHLEGSETVLKTPATQVGQLRFLAVAPGKYPTVACADEIEHFTPDYTDQSTPIKASRHKGLNITE